MMHVKNPLEYPVEKGTGPPVHGNTKTGLPFRRLRVGDSFTVRTKEEYTRACSARAHYIKKMRQKYNELITITSSQVKDRDGKVIGYRFTRENYVLPKRVPKEHH